jgi:hypothetical protein
MTARTKIFTTMAASALAIGAFAAGAGADGTTRSDVSQARDEMHAQMGGAMATGMAGVDWESMQAMHEAIDPAVMQEMHDQMVEQLPPELRDEADAMHDQMFGVMGAGSGFDHSAHHPAGS